MVKTWEQLEQYQPIVLKMLANSVNKKRVAHAYLYEGMRGTGKKEVSFLFAKIYFCKKRVTSKPCNDCVNCRRIDSRNHPDVHILEPDGQSIKKWQIQALQSEFSKTGMESNKKLYIIEHADKMTVNAANSLLKFLEEPGQETVAILLTEKVYQILNTIKSRCQILSFQPLRSEVLKDRLLESGVSNNIASLVANVTNNVEDALKFCEDDWFARARIIVLKLYDVLTNRKVQSIFFISDQWLPHFVEKEQMQLGLDLLLLLYKDLLYIQIGEEENVVYLDQLESLKKDILLISQRRVTENMSAIFEAKGRLGTNMNPQLLMEQLVLRLQEGS